MARYATCKRIQTIIILQGITGAVLDYSNTVNRKSADGESAPLNCNPSSKGNYFGQARTDYHR